VTRPIAYRARQLLLCTRLAVDGLSASRSSTAISVLLVATSVLAVVGAERAFGRLADILTRLADGGTMHSATVSIAGCGRCASAFEASATLQRLVSVASITSTMVRRVGTTSTGKRRVPVLCVSAGTVPAGVSWHSAQVRRDWAQSVGTAGVIAGAELAPVGRQSARALTVETTNGTWQLAGVLHRRPAIAANVAENAQLLVPWREPFTALCARGHVQWQLFGADSIALQRNIDQVTDELRTVHQLRPGHFGTWRVVTRNHFALLVDKLVSRFRKWLLVVPAIIALLCGAGIFSVQALEGASRVQEFGVRRAVGATRAVMVGQLVIEATTVCVVGIVLSCGLLAAAGVLTGGTATGLPALWLAVLVAAPLCGVGLMVPGLSALRVSSIASLEGRGVP
jgi:hypothetical protein